MFKKDIMLSHALELRQRLLRVLFFFILFFVLFFCFSQDVFRMVVAPLLEVLPTNSALISTQMTGPLFVPLRLAVDLALFCSILVLLVELWAFGAPGLYRRECVVWGLYCLISAVWFFLGALFCFYIILPFFFDLMIHASPRDVRFMPDISSVIEFIIQSLLVFGLCFQLPLVVVVMVRLQWVSLKTLSMIRPYVIVLAFVVGMLLTPPDVLSQIMLAVPFWMLYEVGVLCARFFR